MKLLIRAINSKTNKNQADSENKLSTVHIPLHRAFVMFILSYFNFDLSKIDSSTSLASLAEFLQLSTSQLQDFLF